ncbi:PASTA domain-containing protein [Gordonia sp. NPDC003376]
MSSAAGPAEMATEFIARPVAGRPEQSRRERRRAEKAAKRAAGDGLPDRRAPAGHGLNAPAPGRRRKPLIVGVIASVIALIAGGAVGGYLAQNEWANRGTSPVPSVVTAAALPAVGGTGSAMPDLRGLDQDVARQVLADIGVDPARITTTTEPAAGAVGTVIGQKPASGTEGVSEASLVLSTEATMPQLTGQSGQELSVALQKLGAEVAIVKRYQPGAAPGSVVASTPVQGQSLPTNVELVVAEAGTSVYLRKISSAGSGCSSGTYSLNGKDYQNSLACSAGSRQSSNYEWVTKRAADQLTATVGISDTDDDRAAAARVDVFADGRRVASVTAGYGTTVELDATITGALRLSIVVTRVSPGTDSLSAVLGDARLIGSADAIKRLGS